MTYKCLICTIKYDAQSEGGLCMDCWEGLKEINKKHPDDVHRGCRSALRAVVEAGLIEVRKVAVGAAKPDEMLGALRKSGMLLS